MDALTPPTRTHFEAIAATTANTHGAAPVRRLRLTALGIALACGAAVLTANAQAVLPGGATPAPQAAPAPSHPVPSSQVFQVPANDPALEMGATGDPALPAPQAFVPPAPPVPPVDLPPETAPAPEPDPVASLEPGEFLWTPELAPGGDDTVVVVSLPQQRAHVYRNGVRIGVTTVSTGKPGHETPTGVFPILQKREEHYSNLYDNAPMPFMQRLTWDGIALHAGRIPGKPASHGCVRLPMEFAQELFRATGHGTIVVVADYGSHPIEVVEPGDRSPVNPATGIAWSKQREMPAPVVAQADQADPRMAGGIRH